MWVRQLLGGQLGVQMPNMDPAVNAAPVKPAITEPAPAGNGGGAPGVAPAAARQAGNGAAAAQAPRPAGNGVAAKPEGKPEDDENWWTE